MREIYSKVFQSGFDHEYGIGWCYCVVGTEGLILIDPGFGWHFMPEKGEKPFVRNIASRRTESLITPNLRSLLEFSYATGKKILRCILTHGHSDHCANVELLLQKAKEINSFFGREIVELKLIVHMSSVYRTDIFRRIKEETEFELDGHNLLFIPTPGHSQSLDDLSIYFPEKKILFCGDMCQPQGREYHISDGPSPIPFFINGDQAQKSLQRLMTIDFEMLLTAHGYQYNRADGLQALQLTSALLQRIDQLAQKLIQENPYESSNTIALWMYDTITHEREFDRERAEFRKQHFDRNGVSDFQKYDKITMAYFIEKYWPTTTPRSKELGAP